MNSNWITPTRTRNDETNQNEEKFMELTPHDVTVFHGSSFKPNNPMSTTRSHDLDSYSTFHQQRSVLTSPIPQRQDLVAAKDEIIEQKDIIMQKQKTIIVQLRQTNSELEELLIQTQRDQQSFSNEHMDMRIREYQYQISHLQQKVNDEKISRQNEIENLNRKLGEKEYEYGQMAIVMKEGQITQNSQIAKLNKQLDAHLVKLTKEEEKTRLISIDLKNARQKNAKLQSYLEELPTTEEFQLLKTEVKKIKEEKLKVENQNTNLYSKCKETQSTMQSKVLDHKKLLKDYSDLKDKFNKVSDNLKKYKLQDQLGPVPLEDYENIKEELKHTRKKKEELMNSLEKRNKKLNILHYEILQKEKEFESEIVENKEIIEAMKEELLAKNASIITSNAMKCKLEGSNSELQLKLEQLKSTYNEEYKHALGGFLKETDLCVTDMATFINLCKSRLNGKDPSITVLLGLQDSPEKATATTSFDNCLIDLKTILKRKSLLENIRHEIDELRHSLSEQYAEKISEDMCITQ